MATACAAALQLGGQTRESRVTESAIKTEVRSRIGGMEEGGCVGRRGRESNDGGKYFRTPDFYFIVERQVRDLSILGSELANLAPNYPNRRICSVIYFWRC